jgi:hypothetical protein
MERPMTQHDTPTQHPDSDEHKGAVEDDLPHLDDDQPEPHDYMSGQIGHRNADELTDDNDSDFPEPGFSPEHSGEHE